jgi:hypothetical protein
MKKFIIYIVIILYGTTLFSQPETVLLTKQIGKFKFDVLQKKDSKFIYCHQNGVSNIVWQESRLKNIANIKEINMFDSVFIVLYTHSDVFNWTAIVWNGETWVTKLEEDLFSYNQSKITEIRLLDANSVSINTDSDSTIFKYDLNNRKKEIYRVLSFRKERGTHKCEIRNTRDSTFILDYHNGKVDTISSGKSFLYFIKDIGIFDDKFVMVYEDDFSSYFLSMVRNRKKWKANYVEMLYDIKSSGEPPTILTILDEKTIRYQRRGETTIAKIDIENKKITQEKE